MTRITNIVAYLTLLLAFILVLLGGFWLLYPYKPLVFNTPKFIVVTKTVKQGGNLVYLSDYCKYLEQMPVVSRTFANDLLFATPLITTNRPLGCNKLQIVILVPRELPPGTYRLENTYTFQVNPIRKIVVRQNSDNFVVTE